METKALPIKGAKCNFCETCEGLGCIGELPGLGGVFQSENFISNCAAWGKYHIESPVGSPNPGTSDNPVARGNPVADVTEKAPLPVVRLAPITGAVENIGWPEEQSFYLPFLKACFDAGIPLSIGDGTPDEKLLYGIQALQTLKTQAAVFIKPYPDSVFFQRLDWARDVASIVGIDIDSYNIATMRNLVHLEKKTSAQLRRIKNRLKVPFAIKGVFTEEDIKMLSKVKPDIAIISNHGGRIETERGSTADFLAQNASQIRKYAGEIWVDGGLRTKADLQAAYSLQATTVMLARPFITAFLQSGADGINTLTKALLS